MPRCYMVKKVPRHYASSPCSPTEASVAPPCNSPSEHPAVTERPPSVEYEEIGGTPITERSAAETEAAHDLLSLAHSLPPLPPPNNMVAVLPPEPSSNNIVNVLPPEPSANNIVKVLPPEPSANNIVNVLPSEPPANNIVNVLPSEPPANNMVAVLPPEPSSNNIINVLPPEPPANNMIAMLPPEPPTNNMVTVLPPEPPILPIYTYTIQPTNIYIITDEPPEPIYHTMPAIAPMPHFEYSLEPQVSYLAYQPSYQPLPDVPIPDTPMLPILVPAAADIIPEPTPCQAMESEPVVVKTPAIKEKPTKYDCNECGKCYATSSNLSRHKQTHRSLDSVEAKRCEDCGKVYVSMPALAMHVLTHRMGHVCGVCGKLFSRPWLLRGHLRSHTGERPYDCPYDGCTRAFGDRSNLRAHLQTHSGDKKFECSKCQKSFALKSYLAKHEETVCFRDEIMCDPEFVRPLSPSARFEKPCDPFNPCQKFKPCNPSVISCVQPALESVQSAPEIIHRLPEGITLGPENIRSESECIQSEPAIIRFKTACSQFDVECTQFETECLRPEPAIIRFKPSCIQHQTESPESPESMSHESDDIRPQPAVIHFDPSCALPVPKIIRYDQIVLPDLD